MNRTHLNRTHLLVFATFVWTIVAIDAIVHLMIGDLLVPAAMAITFVLWVAIRSRWIRSLGTTRVAIPAD